MPLDFHPPLVNSANPWATTKEDLQRLYDCPYTGAITTRTSIIDGFEHDDSKHQYCFFDHQDHNPSHRSSRALQRDSQLASTSSQSRTSLNTFGYSPTPFAIYLEIIADILRNRPDRPAKPVVFSITGTPTDIRQCHDLLLLRKQQLKHDHSISAHFLLEINLSCPNIAGQPPPAYSKGAIDQYLKVLSSSNPPVQNTSNRQQEIEIGIKTPPFTYQSQFETLIGALLQEARHSDPSNGLVCPISFLTATNTLGNCLALSESSPGSHHEPSLSSSDGSGIGGLGGSALHPLALGNVATLRRMLDTHDVLRHIEIIGVGGVSDADGYERMRSVGAAAVGVGTALGVEGVGVFEKIWREMEGSDENDQTIPTCKRSRSMLNQRSRL